MAKLDLTADDVGDFRARKVITFSIDGVHGRFKRIERADGSVLWKVREDLKAGGEYQQITRISVDTDVSANDLRRIWPDVKARTTAR